MISGIKTVTSDMLSKTNNHCLDKSEIARVMLDYPDRQMSRFDIGRGHVIN
ncbi:dihydroorotase [Streptococcus equi subsp. ruminatorum CECT 5772]|uniref:Dihydroorotase n=1 Tax=Streptococcus equi subsp. ruminatorum CECT 5772 TaxID=1051981 RepID=A0A922T523_9STRE|nr:dihydroorotase [Streptococcus equi subsp. ruminatorum CECT 5772]